MYCLNGMCPWKIMLLVALRLIVHYNFEIRSQICKNLAYTSIGLKAMLEIGLANCLIRRACMNGI